jgi:hypothetical protein
MLGQDGRLTGQQPGSLDSARGSCGHAPQVAGQPPLPPRLHSADQHSDFEGVQVGAANPSPDPTCPHRKTLPRAAIALSLHAISLCLLGLAGYPASDASASEVHACPVVHVLDKAHAWQS